MNRLLIVLVFVGVLVATAFVAQSAQAQTTLSDAHIARIRQNCVTAQTALTQLHASDALLRVNRGRLYELISTKLMAPLNGRIALERLGGLKLAAITVEYDRQRNVFGTSYREYEESMSRVLKINCVEKPVEFYEGVRSTRQKRQRLHDDTETLTTLLKEYKSEFENFTQEFKETNR